MEHTTDAGGDTGEEIAALRRRLAELDETAAGLDRLRFLHAAFTQSITGMALTDAEGDIVYVNAALLGMLGYDRHDDLTGSHVVALFAGDDAARLIDGPGDAQAASLETAARHRDGTHIPVEASFSPVMDNSDVPIGGMLSLVDISERKKAMERAGHLTDVLRAIRNVNQLIVRERNRDRLIQGACDRLVADQGYITARLVLLNDAGQIDAAAFAGPEGSFPGMMDAWRQDDPPDCITRALAGSDLVVVDTVAETCTGCPFIDRDGAYGVLTMSLTYEDTCYGVFTVTLPAERVRDEEECGLFMEAAEDIAFALHSIELAEQHQRAIEELRRKEEKYRLTSENIPVLVYSALPDEHSTNVFLSGRSLALTGYTTEEFLNDPGLWSSIVHPDDMERVWNEIREHRRNRTTLDVEYRIITRDGTTKWIRDKAQPSLDENGGIARIDGFMEDVTERKRAEKEREWAMAEMERALLLEKRFKADAAHFFLNPLAICKGHLELHLERVGREDSEQVIKAKEAIMRIEAVIKNIVEKGEIHE